LYDFVLLKISDDGLLFLDLILRILNLCLKVKDLLILSDDDDFSFCNNLTGLYSCNEEVFYQEMIDICDSLAFHESYKLRCEV
jgi:hypothetical protein